MGGPVASCAFYRGKIASNEGLKYLNYLAGQQRALAGLTPDIVFLSLNFSYHPRTTKTGTEDSCPHQIAEFGVACLDTRRLLQHTAAQITTSEEPIIEAWQYNVPKHGLAKDELATTVTQHIRVRDTNSSDPAALRSVVLVGPSICSDFNVLDRIGVSFSSLAHVVTTMDISTIRHQLFPSAKEDFTPAAFTEWLQPDPSRGSAATNAAYSVHALLRLAVKRAETNKTNQLAQARLPEEEPETVARLVCLRGAVAMRPRIAEAERSGADASEGKDQP